MTRHSHPVGELRPLRRQRLADVQQVIEAFREAPAVDWQAFRDDADAILDQDTEPRG